MSLARGVPGVRWARGLGLVASLALAAALGGCGSGGGFHPLYASSSFGGPDVSRKLATVEVTTIPSRVGQRIRNELLFQVDGGDTPPKHEYQLDIVIQEVFTSSLVASNGQAAEQIYQLDANFKLTRLSDKKVVLQGTSFGRAGLEHFTSVYSNVRAQMEAQNRAASTVAADLRARLSAFLGSTS